MSVFTVSQVATFGAEQVGNVGCNVFWNNRCVT